jgi:hypothetical protein
MTATGVTGRGPALPGRLARSLRGAGLSGARQQGRQAAEAGARHLVLTHLMPGTDPSAARAAARHGYDGEVSVATAGLVLSIG